MRISDWSSDVCSSDLDVAQKHRGAAVDEAAGQPLVKRVGQPVLKRPRPLAPFAGVGQPVRLMGNVGPGPRRSDPVAKLTAIALKIVELCHLAGDPLGWRSDERRVGKEWASQCNYRWSATR